MTAPAARQTQVDEEGLRPLLHARYRERTDWAAPANPVLETVLSHRSVRAFLPDRLPEGTLETLVAAAQSASSSSNLQVWSVAAVEDEARKARLAALAGGQKHIIEAPLFLVWLIDFDRLTRLTPKAAPSRKVSV